jgi:hypothetical protein
VTEYVRVYSKTETVILSDVGSNSRKHRVEHATTKSLMFQCFSIKSAQILLRK